MEYPRTDTAEQRRRQRRADLFFTALLLTTVAWPFLFLILWVTR